MKLLQRPQEEGMVNEEIKSRRSRLCKDYTSVRPPIFSIISKLARQCDGADLNTWKNIELKSAETGKQDHEF